MRAEILTIGDELCRGEIIDTNSSYLAARLWDLDITTRWRTSCGDDEGDMAAALTQAVARADVVICAGGLGPTEDDLTVDVTARLAGVGAVIDEPARARLEERFAGRLAVTPIQLRQVRVPAGARVHGNPAGLAPAFEVELGGVPVICLPGVPRELSAIFDAALVGRLAGLREARGDVERIARRIYRAFGRGESQLSQACRGLVDGVPGASIHYQLKFPEVLVKLVVRAGDQATADARLAELDRGLRARLVPALYGTGDENLVGRVARRLREAAATVATAESCTGGLVGELLTQHPGSSRSFVGGAIAYADDEKVRQLGVAPATLAAAGAVSEETAREMARGACARFGTELAVAVTGVAGPGGGTPDKPVGTVWVALAARAGGRFAPAAAEGEGEGEGAREAVVLGARKLSFPGAREQVRLLSAWWALAMIDATLTAVVPEADDEERARAAWVVRDDKDRDKDRRA